MSIKVIGVLLAGAIAIAGFAIACDDDEPSAEEARAQLCSDLNDLGVELEHLRGAAALHPRALRQKGKSSSKSGAGDASAADGEDGGGADVPSPLP